jgi:hypothetical protein
VKNILIRVGFTAFHALIVAIVATLSGADFWVVLVVTAFTVFIGWRITANRRSVRHD